MQLNDILEEHSLKQISKKTKISEENIERLLEKRFDKLDRVKAIGFISILEREFGIKLDALKKEAADYYAMHAVHEESITVVLPITSSAKRGKSKWFLGVVFALLAYASWYFVTQFDKTHLNTLLPSTEDMSQMFQNTVSDENVSAKELVIGDTVKEEAAVVTQEEAKTEDTSLKAGNEVAEITEATSGQAAAQETKSTESAVQDDDIAPELNITAATQTEQNATVEEPAPSMLPTSIAIVPVGKLWFGLTEKESKAKKQQIIGSKQEFDVNGKSYLIATSTAPFSVTYGEEKKEFRDLKIHYLLLDAQGVRDLSKEEYTQLGGWGW